MLCEWGHLILPASPDNRGDQPCGVWQIPLGTVSWLRRRNLLPRRPADAAGLQVLQGWGMAKALERRQLEGVQSACCCWRAEQQAVSRLFVNVRFGECELPCPFYDTLSKDSVVLHQERFDNRVYVQHARCIRWLVTI